MAVPLKLLLSAGRIACKGHSQQTIFCDWLLGNLADAVGAVFDPLDGSLDFPEGLLLAGDKAECEVTVEGIGARVCLVLTVGRQVTRVVFG